MYESSTNWNSLQAVTLPISIECVVDTGKVSAVLANVILPMGANIVSHCNDFEAFYHSCTHNGLL